MIKRTTFRTEYSTRTNRKCFFLLFVKIVCVLHCEVAVVQIHIASMEFARYLRKWFLKYSVNSNASIINRSRFCCKFAKTKSQIKFKNAFSWLRPLWLRHIEIWSSQDMNPDVFMTFALAKKYRFQFCLFHS